MVVTWERNHLAASGIIFFIYPFVSTAILLRFRINQVSIT